MKLDKLQPITISAIKPDYLSIIVSEIIVSYYAYLVECMQRKSIDKYTALKDLSVLQELQKTFGKKILRTDMPEEMQVKFKHHEAIVFSESLDYFNTINTSLYSSSIAFKINEQLAPKL